MIAAPTADRSTLQRVLDGRWHEVRDRAREIAQDPTFYPPQDVSDAEYREVVLAQAQALAKLGMSGIGYPAQYGGNDDVGGAVTAFEMLAYGDLSLLVKAGVQWGLFGGAVLHLGTRRHHEKYLRDIMSLDLPGCFAMTETGHGSDVASCRTTATFDAATDEFVVHTPFEAARKDYIGNAAAHGRAAVVFAQLRTDGRDHGVHAFFVPIRDADGEAAPGVTIGDNGKKGGLNGVDNGRLSFDHVRIPRENLLNRYADVAADGTYTTPIANPGARFFTMLGTLIQGRISVAGGAGAAAREALTIATRYAEARRQFVLPGADDEIVIMDYLAHQRKILPALARSYALHFAQLDLVSNLHEVFTATDVSDEQRRELEASAAGVKALGTWHATSAIQMAREACGGNGYLVENRLPTLKADTDVFTTFEGDNTVLLQLVAKELLTSYRTAFGELDTVGMIRFVGGRVVSTVAERTAARGIVTRLLDAAPGRDEEADLLDRAHQLELLTWREKHVVDGLARRLRRIRSDAPDAFAQFNRSQDHLLLAARAHVERTILESFVAALDEIGDPDAAALLGRVCDLYVLSAIEADKAWFLEHGRLTPRRSRAVTETVNALCLALRPHARLLTDAFGIPEAALDVPIARGDETRRQQESRAAGPAPVPVKDAPGSSSAQEAHTPDPVWADPIPDHPAASA